MSTAKSRGVLAELEAILDDVAFMDSTDSVKSYTVKSLFKTNTHYAFKFSGEVVQYRGEAGGEASLVVNLKAFPDGISITSFELTDLDKKAIDWSFELIVEKVDGTIARLSPFDLIQIKRRFYDYSQGELDNVARLKFNNFGATQDSRFNIGLIQIS